MIKEALMPVFMSVLSRDRIWFSLELAYNWRNDNDYMMMECNYYESRYHNPL